MNDGHKHPRLHDVVDVLDRGVQPPNGDYDLQAKVNVRENQRELALRVLDARVIRRFRDMGHDLQILDGVLTARRKYLTQALLRKASMLRRQLDGNLAAMTEVNGGLGNSQDRIRSGHILPS